jgi:nucleolar protein 56
MIIQAIALIDQLDKNINTFAMRVREWYGYHFPEMVRICNDNYSYAKLIQLIGRRECLLQAMQEAEDAEEGAEAPELIKKMEEILMDSTKVQSIQDAARKSVGMEISDIDLINVEHFSKQVVELVEYRKELTEYLRSKMKSVAPNLAALIGDVVGARLISHAGSITNLAKYPASTVQILGAEKALFRALKKKGNTPKYGLIFHSTFIGRAAQKNKGRISRYLANKASIASRLDCFSEEPNAIVGAVLKQQVEDRLNFFETGETPKKNIDVMHAAMDALNEGENKKEEADDDMKTEEVEADSSAEKKKKKKSKKNKRKSEAEEMDTEEPEAKKEKTEEVKEEAEPEVASPEKKKKKKKKKSVAPDSE